MANIYTISSPGTAFAANKCMLGIFNGVGSGKVVRVYKIYQMNAQTQALTGLNNIMGIWRITTGSGGLAVQVVKHDSQSSNLPAQIICATNMDYTADADGYRFQRYTWSSDEPLASDAQNIDEIQTNPNFGLVMDYTAAYVNTTVVPPTLREGYGLAVILEGAFSAGVAALPVGVTDIFIEFTVEAS